MSRQPSKLLTHGLPLVTLTLAGWLGIAYFMQGRIDVEVCANYGHLLGFNSLFCLTYFKSDLTQLRAARPA
jgi:hypothetical protein